MPDEHSNTAPGHNKPSNIILNGTEETVSGQWISYEQVVSLAFPGDPSGNLYTVSYANPHGKDGTLAPGQDTKVKEGMSFNVLKTNRS